VVDVVAGVRHARASVVTGEILAMMTELAQEGPSEAELEKARRRQAWETTAMLDSAEEMGGFFARGLLFERFETPADRMERMGRVTAGDVQGVARILAQPERLNVVAVGLLENDEDKRLSDAVKGWRGARP